MDRKEGSSSEGHYRMDYDQCRDDQMNTGIIAALIGGFSLTNTWELEGNGNLLDTVTYVLGIFAVHACTCSALTSAFLYRTLTNSDPEKGVAWIHEHTVIAHLPYHKFVIGTLAYLASVILVAWKELDGQEWAKIATLVIGIMGCSMVFGIFLFCCNTSPSKIKW
jgi:hypothetical protein